MSAPPEHDRAARLAPGGDGKIRNAGDAFSYTAPGGGATGAAFVVTVEMIRAVHAWTAIPPAERIGRPLVPLLRERFSITPGEAIAVIEAANRGGADERAPG